MSEAFRREVLTQSKKLDWHPCCEKERRTRLLAPSLRKGFKLTGKCQHAYASESARYKLTRKGLRERRVDCLFYTSRLVDRIS